MCTSWFTFQLCIGQACTVGMWWSKHECVHVCGLRGQLVINIWGNGRLVVLEKCMVV